MAPLSCIPGLALTSQKYVVFLASFDGRSRGPWHYRGQGVKLGTPDTPIFWYQPPGSTTRRVIYADLSVYAVAPEDLPK
ncbi:MAG: hypothetical protein MUC88_01190 [Planctomycetes bacterium]|nr:hypothetical protein [Planctomycetota bacterium]